MKVLHVSLDEVKKVVFQVGRELYEDNLCVKTGTDRTNSRVKRCTFSLGVVNSGRDMAGARCLADSSLLGSGPRGGVRTPVACWHAHHDVLEELFFQFRHARVETRKANYTAENFMVVSYTTAFEDVAVAGSKPMRAMDLCDCGEMAWPFDEDEFDKDGLGLVRIPSGEK